jgi:hypothetical protein
MQLTGAVSNRRPAARAPDYNTPGGRPDIPPGVWPWDANGDADIRPSLANLLNRLGYFQHVASMLHRLMLDHASTITRSMRLISCVTATSRLSGRMLATRRT